MNAILIWSLREKSAPCRKCRWNFPKEESTVPKDDEKIETTKTYHKNQHQDANLPREECQEASETTYIKEGT